VSQSRDRSAADLFLLVKVAAASMVGAIAAAGVLWLVGDLDRGRTLGALALAVVVLNVTVAWLLASRETTSFRPAASPWTPAPRPPLAPAPVPRQAPARRPPLAPAPVPRQTPAEPGQVWYVEAARDAEALRGVAAPDIAFAGATAPLPAFGPTQPAAELDGPSGRVEEHRVPGRTGSVRRIVQCPECGDFDVDVWSEPAGFAFTCRRCRGMWQWAPGTPWPATIIQPARGRIRPTIGSS